MTGQGIFWYLLGAMSGLAVAVVLLPLLRTFALGGRRRLIITAAIALFASVAAFVLYIETGSPELAAGRRAALSADATHASSVSTTSGEARTMEAATQQLAERLTAGGGTDADWQLLASSYEFLGRKDDAERARGHSVLPVSTTTTVAALQGNTQSKSPRDAAELIALAQSRRVARDFKGAVDAFEKSFKLQPGTADDWADYADALAAASGRSLQGAPAAAIKRALALDPNHTKALWLAASLSLEQRNYPEALAQWQRLRSALPENSPDVAIVEGNIQEARELGAQSIGKQAAGSSAATARIDGTVQVDPALRGKVSDGMTLFIYAKSPDGAGAPLAVVKAPAGAWPVKFVLDDSLAMLPDRVLSGFERARVEARLSKTGNAIAQKGDLVAAGELVPTRGGKSVALTISREIG